MINWCESCSGTGHVAAPKRRWWQIYKRAQCIACGGDGYARPKGPRPAPPSAPPPPKKPDPPRIVVIIEGQTKATCK